MRPRVTIFEIKRGTTLALACRALRGPRAALDLTGWTVSASVRAGAAYIHHFVPVVNARAGEFELHASAAETALWPTGLLTADIRYAENSSGHVVASETFSVCVLPGETP